MLCGQCLPSLLSELCSGLNSLFLLSCLSSVGLIVLGAFIAGARDLSFDAYGYGVVFLANITTAIYLATIARIGDTSLYHSFPLVISVIS